jgi:HD-GYP domain-containing protein (c-di-GMP phosphodiesterase class II)
LASSKEEYAVQTEIADGQLLIGADIETNVIEEFVAEYEEAHAEIEMLVLKLQNQPTDTNLLNNLFRQVHTIKGNSHFIGIELIADLVHALENVLDKVRKRDLRYEQPIGNVVLACMDYIGDLYSNVRLQQPVDGQFIHHLQTQLRNLACCAQFKVPAVAQRIIHLFGDNSLLSENEIPDWYGRGIDINQTSQQLEDLKFYAQLIEQAEQRSPFWENRSQHILNIALAMNSDVGIKVDSAQLEAAVYLHDFYMAFLPLDLLHKENRLSDVEFQSVKLHPQMGAALLGDNRHWRDAAAMIVHHHEREDGTGYPNRLTGDQICGGAKILAIADAFESMTNRRADRINKISVTQAVREINNNSGSQFSSYWVDVFNNVIRNILNQN